MLTLADDIQMALDRKNITIPTAGIMNVWK